MRRRAQAPRHALGGHHQLALALRTALRDLQRTATCETRQLAAQAPHAGFPRVAVDQVQDRGVLEHEATRGEARFLEHGRYQVALGDGQLLQPRVARQVHDLHAVAQRPRDGAHVVGRGHEEHVRQVVGHVQVVVGERLVLRRVQHLEQRTGRIAPRVRAHLVDLVDEEEAVGAAGPTDGLQDLAGHRAHVGAPVPADLALVPHAAHAEPREGSTHGVGHAAPEAGLADARRSDEAEHGRARIVGQPLHGQVLEDALLDVFQAVVRRVEHVAGLAQVHAPARRHLPGQVEQPLHVGAHHVLLAAGLRHAPEALDFAQRDLFHGLRQATGLDGFAQRFRFGGRVAALAQLAMDGPELRAQQLLALARGELGLHARADLLLHLVAGQGLGEGFLDDLQAFAHGRCGQQVTLQLERQPQVGAEQVGEAACAGDVHAQDVDHLGRVAALRLHELVHQLHAAHDPRVDVGPLGLVVVDRADAELEVGLGANDLLQPDAPQALQHDLHRVVGHAHAVDDTAGHADRQEVLQALGEAPFGLGLARQEARDDRRVARRLVEHVAAARPVDGHAHDIERKHDRAGQAQARQLVGDRGAIGSGFGIDHRPDPTIGLAICGPPRTRRPAAAMAQRGHAPRGRGLPGG